MKLLLYGGCHALILRRLIEDLGPLNQHEVDLMINFELVRSGRPFPYDKLRDYDAIIYSPIENRGEYNTVNLDLACSLANVQAIRFPWLEWHGYAPGADKDLFWGHVGWFFPHLVKMGELYEDITTFITAAITDFPSDESVHYFFDYSTDKLRCQENRVGCEIRVVDFILDGFRDRRMFLLPDHPSLLVYQHVLGQLERLLGTKLIEYWPKDLPEPQPEAQTPILPRVAEALRLNFRDETWRCDTQPLGTMTLAAFLALHHARAQALRGDAASTCDEQPALKVATASRSTWLTPLGLNPAGAAEIPVPMYSQMLIRASERTSSDASVFRADVLSTLAGAPEADHLAGKQLFRTEDWVCRA